MVVLRARSIADGSTLAVARAHTLQRGEFGYLEDGTLRTFVVGDGTRTVGALIDAGESFDVRGGLGVLADEGVPSDEVGRNGEMYFDLTARALWGPKLSDSWDGTGPTSLVGATGPAGEDGEDGAQGPQGEQGIQGIQGIQGEQGETGPAGADGVFDIDDVDDESIVQAKLAPAVLRKHVRPAAFSGLGAASSAGAFAQVSWAPTGTPSFRLRVVLGSGVPHGGTVRPLGRSAATYANLAISNTGVVSVQHDGVDLLASAAGAYLFGGPSQDVYADITNTTATIVVDGITVASGSFASQGWTTVAGTLYIGAHSSNNANRWPGYIQLAEIVDLVTAANSRRYLLDETTGNYADSSGNGGAAATRNGFVDTCAVLSADGLGRVWQGRGPLVYSCTRAAHTTGITGVTTYAPTVSVAETLDPTGSLTNTVFTAPAAGVLVATFTGALEATTLAAPDVVLVEIISTSGGAGAYTSTETHFNAANVITPFVAHYAAAVAAGETVTARFSNIVAADVYTLKNGWRFALIFYPNAA